MCEYQHLQGAYTPPLPQHILQSPGMRMINDVSWVYEKQGRGIEAVQMQAQERPPEGKSLSWGSGPGPKIHKHTFLSIEY